MINPNQSNLDFFFHFSSGHLPESEILYKPVISKLLLFPFYTSQIISLSFLCVPSSFFLYQTLLSPVCQT